MSEHAAGTFKIESWEEEPYDEREGAKLTRTRLRKTFRGDVEGESTAELLMAYAAEEGSAASPCDASASWSVVPDSGTGELRGLRGEALITNEPDGGHSFTLDYYLEREAPSD
jgi:hypothetical protein